MKKSMTLGLIIVLLLSAFQVTPVTYAELDQNYKYYKYFSLGTVMTYSEEGDSQQKANINGKITDVSVPGTTPVIHSSYNPFLNDLPFEVVSVAQYDKTAVDGEHSFNFGSTPSESMTEIFYPCPGYLESKTDFESIYDQYTGKANYKNWVVKNRHVEYDSTVDLSYSGVRTFDYMKELELTADDEKRVESTFDKIYGMFNIKPGSNFDTVLKQIQSEGKAAGKKIGKPYSFKGRKGFIFIVPTVITVKVPLTPPDNLKVTPINVPQSSGAGVPVEVNLKIDSSFKEQKSTSYAWSIVNTKTGKPVPGVSYSGLMETATGSLNVFPAANANDDDNGNAPIEQGDQIAKASFMMPDGDVAVSFKINPSGTAPVEADLTDNSFVGTILKKDDVAALGGYNLGFNVLSKEIAHPLSKGNDQTASVSISEGDWTGPMTGELNITKDDSKGFLQNYEVEDNPPVNEDSETVTRKPIIGATVYRKTFGDDPVNRTFINLSNPWNPLTGSADLRYGGSVSRPWKYTWSVPCSKHGSHTYTRTGTAHGNFGNILNLFVDTLNLNAYTYNGKKPESMPYVAARDFKEVVENNSTKGDLRHLFWISDPYNMNVIRWMVNEKLNPADNTYEDVDGQYQRTFTQQDSGTIEFSVNHSMASIYKSDRTAARNGSRSKGSYPSVVFATDRDLQKYNYPIKSGYYLTPRGEYTVTINTSLYKNTPDNTKEHADLVKKMIEAFHYQSDMSFTLNGSDQYALDISSDHDKVQGVDMLGVDKDFDKNVEELNHTENSADAEKNTENDPRIRGILEGYADSNTQYSKDNFKYREYLKDGQHLYKVNEKTVITFTVNPNHKKLYTYVNMMDSDRKGSDYAVRTWFENMPLTMYGYQGLTINGRSNLDDSALDTLKFSVKGSMYDDTNN